MTALLLCILIIILTIMHDNFAKAFNNELIARLDRIIEILEEGR